jgi:predicted lipoprotein with Yx(FWY)xxD motif
MPAADGSKQIMYNRHPLYYSYADRNADDTWGHGAMSFGGRFSLVSRTGDPLPPPR